MKHKFSMAALFVGSGLADMLADLSVLARLVETHPELLVAARFTRPSVRRAGGSATGSTTARTPAMCRAPSIARPS